MTCYSFNLSILRQLLWLNVPKVDLICLLQALARLAINSGPLSMRILAGLPYLLV